MKKFDIVTFKDEVACRNFNVVFKEHLMLHHRFIIIDAEKIEEHSSYGFIIIKDQRSHRLYKVHKENFELYDKLPATGGVVSPSIKCIMTRMSQDDLTRQIAKTLSRDAFHWQAIQDAYATKPPEIKMPPINKQYLHDGSWMDFVKKMSEPEKPKSNIEKYEFKGDLDIEMIVNSAIEDKKTIIYCYGKEMCDCRYFKKYKFLGDK